MVLRLHQFERLGGILIILSQSHLRSHIISLGIAQFKLYEWDREVLNKEVEFKPALEPAAYYPLLKQGSKGQYVLYWQIFLNSSGYICGLEDGIFGKNTKLAVQQFQYDNNLTPDGIIGPKTWNAVHELTKDIAA